jgi:hypothetical protein
MTLPSFGSCHHVWKGEYLLLVYSELWIDASFWWSWGLRNYPWKNSIISKNTIYNHDNGLSDELLMFWIIDMLLAPQSLRQIKFSFFVKWNVMFSL